MPRKAVLDRPTADKRRKAPTKPVPSGRGAGHRAGLTQNMILEAAKRALAAGSGPVTIKAVASRLGVAHNSISSRLKREGTTLDRELAKDFLFDLSKPMLPGEDWRTSLRALFEEALASCEARPGLARTVVPWIGHDPTLCAEFTERVLTLVQAAGLRDEASVAAHEAVVASLCGMLSIRFPTFGGTSKRWAIRMTRTMATIESRRFPLLSREGRAMTEVARHKLPIKPKGKAPIRHATVMAEVAIGYLRHELASASSRTATKRS